MTYSKKQWMMLILGAGVLFLVYWFFFRKKKMSIESSYDNNLMIFGNENGYTNYQLDGGSLESSYGPEFGAYGSYGNESSYQDWAWPTTGRNGKKCPYKFSLVTSGENAGWCHRDGALASPMGGPGKPTPTPTNPIPPRV
jgi:hypothetical protein